MDGWKVSVLPFSVVVDKGWNGKCSWNELSLYPLPNKLYVGRCYSCSWCTVIKQWVCTSKEGCKRNFGLNFWIQVPKIGHKGMKFNRSIIKSRTSIQNSKPFFFCQISVQPLWIHQKLSHFWLLQEENFYKKRPTPRRLVLAGLLAGTQIYSLSRASGNSTGPKYFSLDTIFECIYDNWGGGGGGKCHASLSINWVTLCVNISQEIGKT